MYFKEFIDKFEKIYNRSEKRKMCELLGMSFNQLINPKVFFKEFQKRGKNNPDGWGIAVYKNKKVLIKKEAINALSSDFLTEKKNLENILSKIIIGHLRKKSQGEASLNNTHPFFKELNGKDYIFAHNGGISSYKKIKLKYFFPKGDTDSEYIFCHLLDLIKEKKIKNYNFYDFRWLEQELKKINGKGELNCIFSDGKHLFCYYDKNGYNNLYFIQEKSPYRQIKLKDIDWEIDLRKEKPFDQIGYIISTKPLTNESWEKFKKGELIIFKKGEIIYSTYKNMAV